MTDREREIARAALRQQQPEQQQDQREFERWMEVVRKVSAEHEEALRELAKL
jgi:hypothetical protein